MADDHTLIGGTSREPSEGTKDEGGSDGSVTAAKAVTSSSRSPGYLPVTAMTAGSSVPQTAFRTPGNGGATGCSERLQDVRSGFEPCTIGDASGSRFLPGRHGLPRVLTPLLRHFPSMVWGAGGEAPEGRLAGAAASPVALFFVNWPGQSAHLAGTHQVGRPRRDSPTPFSEDPLWSFRNLCGSPSVASTAA